MTIKRFQVLQQDSVILKKLAGQFPHNSKEYSAIERAALALAFVVTEDFDKFTAFVKGCESDLTEEQKAHISSMGLDAD